MKTARLLLTTLLLPALTGSLAAQSEDVVVRRTTWSLNSPPTLISMSGFTGEVEQVLRFDLEVMGCKIVPEAEAKYHLTGSNASRLEARFVDAISKAQLLGKAYAGDSARVQAHTLADEVIEKLPNHGRGIARTRIAFKVDTGRNSEIAVADYDGYGAQTVTSDNTIAVAPKWAPGRNALFFTSHRFNSPDIFLQDLSTGERRVVAQFAGSNLSPAPSPDGRRLAAILSKDGWVDLYVMNSDGSDARRLTRSREHESSPCWTHDSQQVIFAGVANERRGLYRVSAAGGQMQRISTSGVANPTEPDVSPDGKWIAFTSQRGGGFDICVVPAAGGTATVLVEGEDPSWAPNSRNLIYARRTGSGRVLSLLDVPTKQMKDVRRISGGASQPAWAK